MCCRVRCQFVFFSCIFLLINAQDILLNEGWSFQRVHDSKHQVNANFSTKSYFHSPTTVNLPHTSVSLSYRDWNPLAWDADFHYSKEFDLPFSLDWSFSSSFSSSFRFFLLFEGILTSAEISINDNFLGEQVGGYVPFKYEITSYVKEKRNVLDVVVNGRYLQEVPPNWYPVNNANYTDFYQPSGIYRSVHLIIVPRAFLADVFVKPLNVLSPSTRALNVTYKIDLSSSSSSSFSHLPFAVNYTIISDLIDAQNRVVSSFSSSGHISSSCSVSSLFYSNLSSIILWNLTTPYLYFLNSSLTVEGESVTHNYSVRFGFREAVFTKAGFFLNGERLQIIGLNRHQWFPYMGGAMSWRGQVQDVKILKRAVNMIRQSHYPQSSSFLDACDELGVLVWIETPGWDWLWDSSTYLKLVLRDVKEMIERDRNHPSVVVYGVRLNETPNNAKLWSATQALAKSLDDSRQTTAAMVYDLCNTIDYQQDLFSCNDYTTKIVNATKTPWLLPPRHEFPYLVSEAVGALSGFDHYYSRWDSVVVQQDQALSHAIVHNLALSLSSFSGVIAWCGFDYPSGNGYTVQLTKTAGVFDIFRIPKLGAAPYFAQISYDIVIEPSFYWCFNGEFSVSTLSSAFIWANVETLQIEINGVHFMTLLPSTNELYSLLKHPPFVTNFSSLTVDDFPDLVIRAYIGSKMVAMRSFSSDPSFDRFELVADSQEIEADGSDTTRIVMRVVDKYGNLRPSKTGNVSMQLVGDSAILIGDNPFPLGDTGGAAAVWLRSIGEGRKGVVMLSASHDHLGSANVSVRVI